MPVSEGSLSAATWKSEKRTAMRGAAAAHGRPLRLFDITHPFTGCSAGRTVAAAVFQTMTGEIADIENDDCDDDQQDDP